MVKPRKVVMKGSEIKATFGNGLVDELEQQEDELETGLRTLMAMAEAEKDSDKATELREQADELRVQLSKLTHRIRKERSAFTDIARGRTMS